MDELPLNGRWIHRPNVRIQEVRWQIEL